jgi:hypothetical protein
MNIYYFASCLLYQPLHSKEKYLATPVVEDLNMRETFKGPQACRLHIIRVNIISIIFRSVFICHPIFEHNLPWIFFSINQQCTIKFCLLYMCVYIIFLYVKILFLKSFVPSLHTKATLPLYRGSAKTYLQLEDSPMLRIHLRYLTSA